ncbi:MAG: hypothetical protein ACI392_07435 [Paludibacteraceae bacterium]
MNKIALWMACVAVAMMMCGCDDAAAVRSAKGTYSFKTSGQAVLDSLEGDAKSIVLDDESGQLEIISLHDADSLLLTFNQMGGGVYSSRGTLKDNELRFEPYARTYSVVTTVTVYDTVHTVIGGVIGVDSISGHNELVNDVFDITVSGVGHVYDKSIIFQLRYDGRSASSERILTAENVQMIAKKN